MLPAQVLPLGRYLPADGVALAVARLHVGKPVPDVRIELQVEEACDVVHRARELRVDRHVLDELALGVDDPTAVAQTLLVLLARHQMGLGSRLQDLLHPVQSDVRRHGRPSLSCARPSRPWRSGR